MIEAEPQFRQDEFISFMEQAVPDLLGIELAEITDTYDFRARVASLQDMKDAVYAKSELELSDAYSSMPTTFMLADGSDFDLDHEKDILENIKPGTLPSPYNTALMEFVGDAAIEKIARELPREIAEAADEWKKANKHEREDILRFLFDRLRFSVWENSKEIYTYEENKLGQTIYEVDAAHPDNIVNWPNCEKVNCLGAALLLTAFASRAGADFVFVNTIRKGDVEGAHLALENAEKTQEYFDTRGVGVHGSYDKLLQSVRDHFDEVDSIVDDFHHSIAIKTGDDDWFLLDPYQLNLANMTDSYFLVHEIYPTMDKHFKVFPGRTVLDGIHFAYNTYMKALSSEHKAAAEIADQMYDYLRPLIEKQRQEDISFDEFEEIMCNFKPAKFEADNELEEAAINYQLGLFDETWMKLLMKSSIKNTATTLGIKDDERVDISEDVDTCLAKLGFDFKQQFSKDRYFRERFIDDVVGMVIICAHQSSVSTYGHYYDGGETPEVTLEYGNPNFSAGLFLLNHLRVWSEYGNKYVSSVLAEQTSSQLMWHEAMQDVDPVESEVLGGLERSLGRLGTEWLHERVAWQLFVREQERKNASKEHEPEASGEEGR